MNPNPRASEGVGKGALLGTGVLGLGTGLQLSCVFILGARIGLGTPLDTAVFAGMGALLLVLGALLFGSWVRRAGHPGMMIAGVAAAVASLLGLTVVAATTSPLGFKAHCARFGSDASLAGTPWVDGTAALVMFVAPAFGAGALLASARTRGIAASLVFGGVLGWWLRPTAFELLADAQWKGAGSPGVLVVGAGISGAGLALFAALGPHRSRTLGVMCGAILSACAMALPITALVVYPPWQRFTTTPKEIFETARHQFTLLPGGGELQVLLVDQRPVTPSFLELELERACLVRSMELFREVAGDSADPPKTLVVGVVTPERARLLAEAGIESIDQAALFAEESARLMEQLWDGEAPPANGAEWLTLKGSGDDAASYDLVFSFPHGALSAGGFDLELARRAKGRVKTLWLDPDVGVPPTGLGEEPGARIAMASHGLERLAFGLVAGLPPETAGLYDLAPRPLGLGWMGTRPERRPLAMAAETAARIADLEGAGPWEHGLALHAAAQAISSPFEAPLDRIELDPSALAKLRDHILSKDTSPNSVERGVIEGIALTLRSQGRVPLVFEILGEITAKFPGAPRLEQIAAWAEAQELEFEAAVKRLRPLIPENLDGASPLERAAATQLADALVALGEGSADEGRDLALSLAREDPSNPELFGLARRVRGTTTIGPVGTGYEALSLGEAKDRMDGAFLGEITGRRVLEVDPGDGAPLYMTELTILGTEVAKGATTPGREIQVLFPGGFQDLETGSFNSMAPPRHRTQVGRLVLAFYETSDNIIGGLGGHAVLSGGAGLYSAFRSRTGKLIIQGRGQTSAVTVNIEADDLGDLLRVQ